MRCTSSIVFALSLALGSLSAGCAIDGTHADNGGADPTADKEAELTSSEKAAVKEFEAAVVGLMSNGGEGDPSPFKVITVKLGARDTMTNATLAQRIVPRIPELNEARSARGGAC